MRVLTYSAWILASALLSSVWLVDRCMSQEIITAYLTDGRRVTGVVDARTDLSHLWTRRAAATVEVASGFAWESVDEVYLGGHRLDAAQILTLAERFSAPEGLVQEPTSVAWPEHSERSEKQPLSPIAFGPVKTLVIKAFLAQWDDDAQSDGVRVIVSPLDAQGRLVPVDGQLNLTLVTESQDINSKQGFANKPVFREAERISHVVRREHFDSGPAMFELPFSNQHPDFDTRSATEALLYARLGVPGKGVFEASDAQLYLREHSRFRDQLQHYSPHRYLPVEGSKHIRR